MVTTPSRTPPSPSRAARRLGLLLLALAPLGAEAARAEVLVFAAASLQGALDEVAEAWEAETGGEATISYAGSPALARQILQGAPAEVLVTASPEWMDAVEAGGLVRDGARRDLLGNRLALVGPRGAELAEIGPGFDLPARLGEDGRLAMALVDAVPAGIHGREALRSLGLWEAAEPRVAQADNVRAALALVARGEAALGIVYATDARAEPRVGLLGLFPEGSHAPILYPAALLDAADAEAEAFFARLVAPESGAVFERHGFTLP